MNLRHDPLGVEASATLRTRDLDTILNAAQAVDRAVPTEVAIKDILGALSGLVCCDLLFWTRFDTQLPFKIEQVGHPHAPDAATVRDWIAHRQEHRICSGKQRLIDSPSYVISRGELQTPARSEMYWRQAGWEHEIGINLVQACCEIHDIVICRGPGPDFNDRDQVVLRLLRPHLDSALRQLAYPAPRLTPREVQVLRHVRDGMPNHHIAQSMGIAESTVVKHLEHIYTRSGAHSRTQAVQLCLSALG